MSNKINISEIKEGDILFDVLFGNVIVTDINKSYSKYKQLTCKGYMGSGTITFEYSINGYQEQFTNLPRLYITNPFK